MEENKEVMEDKLSYEQLEMVAAQLQKRAMQAEARLSSVNLTTMRLDYLFRVLNYSTHFSEDFIKDCVAEIVDILKVENPEQESTGLDSPEE